MSPCFAFFISQILQSLGLGVDLISTNYPECLAKAGRALALRLPGDPEVVDTAPASVVAVNTETEADAEDSKKRELAGESERSSKRPRIDYSNPHSLPQPAASLDAADVAGQSACANKRGPGKHAAKAVAPSEADFPMAKCEMNLWDVKYRKDTRPLVSFASLFNSFTIAVFSLSLPLCLRCYSSRVARATVAATTPALTSTTCT